MSKKINGCDRLVYVVGGLHLRCKDNANERNASLLAVVQRVQLIFANLFAKIQQRNERECKTEKHSSVGRKKCVTRFLKLISSSGRPFLGISKKNPSFKVTQIKLPIEGWSTMEIGNSYG